MLDFKKQVVDYLTTREDPVKLNSILKNLGYDKTDRQYLRGILAELVKDSKVIRDGNRYWVPMGKQVSLEHKREKTRAKKQLTGKLSINRKGQGFVLNQRGEDWFIPPSYLKNAKQGDIVQAERVERGRGIGPGRVVGEVIKIESYGTVVAVGIFERKGMDVWFTAFGDMRLERHQLMGFPSDVADGTVGQFNRLDEGKWQFASFLGKITDSKVDEAIVLAENNIQEAFPQEAITACEALEADYPFELGDRVDFRNRTVFTVDGETARDFDDALHFHELENGNMEVGIHIADVSQFVLPGSPLDEVAKDRGNSVYLPHKAIPMLPERLSTDLCSLKPNVPRYTLSVVCEMDNNGKPVGFKIFKGLIVSSFRLTYNNVVAIGVERDEQAREAFAGVVPSVEIALNLSRKMRVLRHKAGGLQLDMAEVRAVLDEDRLLKEINLTRQTDANRMIEAFMCLANECVATYFDERGIGIPYRIHDVPDPGRLDNLAAFWVARGYKVPEKFVNHTGAALNEMIEKLQHSPAGEVLQLQVLKSLKLAEYNPENRGHFGLASTHYAHFTSPIRRYADLLVHQRISYMIHLDKPRPEHFDDAALSSICSHISGKERAAMRAEQTYLQLKQLRRMLGEVGNHFEGVITEVKPFGFFVRLNPWQVSGLVHLDNMLDDYYVHDAESLALVGKRKGTSWGVGDTVEVSVDLVDIVTRRVVLSPLSTSKAETPFKKRVFKPRGPVNAKPKKKRFLGPGKKKRRH